MHKAGITVGMTQVFLRDAEAILDENDLFALAAYLACNPKAGDIIPRTGGVRKLRWKLAGRGKRGGARVIYFYYDQEIPLYVFAIYAKNEKDDLNAQEKKELQSLTREIVASRKRKRKAS